MTHFTRTRTLIAAAGVAVAAAAGTITATAPAADAAPPLTNALSFHIPAIGGLELPPPAVPGGSFQRTTVTARPGMRPMIFPPAPATVQFTAEHIAPYHYEYPNRFVTVDWRNLRNGKTGHLDLRYWEKGPTTTGYPVSLPTSGIAPTGSGPVVATVTVKRLRYQGPPAVISLIPGVAALNVPN
ncbi:hypothetical protein L5G32_15030 [Gordonia sp. HY002]|uniref:hypothetical protein n=1 Tax=Gordonia zhenghanii TaxID=2911516 RepID=UPI001EEF9E25|nr:hypothetical protein [Gordonia zhenghanii]MCF8571584.1 hypothetical protein [Gordonia zhenghanii]MCF8602181.1 hypothetical protein [Gordonia zhenghanii]